MTPYATRQGVDRHPKNAFIIEDRICRAITGVAEGNSPVLIAGEPGVGKPAIAEAIHRQSRYASGAFRQVSAADSNATDLAAALSSRGTIYLSDVAALSQSLQGVLIEHCFRGDRVQCRLLCGTSFDLMDQVKLNRVREDFYHLISTVTLRISPLRFRKSDILPISDHFLTQYSSQFDRPRPALGKDITEFLLEHTWPGNLPELETAIKTLVIIGDQSITLHALKATLPGLRRAGFVRPVSLKMATRAASIEVQRQLIGEVLAATGGNRKRAADELGISYKALLYKLKQVTAAFNVPSTGNGNEQ